MHVALIFVPIFTLRVASLQNCFGELSLLATRRHSHDYFFDIANIVGKRGYALISTPDPIFLSFRGSNLTNVASIKICINVRVSVLSFDDF
jgi:hypothetical protein